ncbi:MAG: cysteine-rich CWC family protein [Methylocella sp.]
MSRLPLSHGHRHLRPVERRITCERCGREFGCSRDGLADCWCNAEPYRLPMPPRAGRFGNCLCPNRLREFAAQLRIPGAAAGT